MKALLLASACCLLFVGCTTVNTVGSQTRGTERNVVADKRVVNDITLDGKLIIGDVIESTVSGDLRKIQVDVTNRNSSRIDVLYKVEWFGKDGMRVDTAASGWKRLSLDGRESSTIAVIAQSPAAHDFVIKFRET